MDLLESAPLKSIKNRVLVSQISKTTKQSKRDNASHMSESASHKNPGKKPPSRNESVIVLRKDSDKEFTGSFLTRTFSKLSNLSTYHIFLISQKPLNAVEEEHFLIDDEIMEKGILREPISFNRIFFFEYKSFGDSSPARKVLAVENITSVSAVIHKDEYHLKVKLESGKWYFFMFGQATEALLWLHGLRKAVQTQEELSRSKCGVLRYNIGLLYKYHEHNKWTEIQEIVGSIVAPLDPEMAIEAFISQLEATISEANFFCDAFFSYKPFMQSLFESMVKSIHVSIRSALMDFWNKNYLEMMAGEILTFGKTIYKYQKMLKTWGVSDRKLGKCDKPIIITFCNRLFNSSKEILFNVIDEAMFKFRLEEGRYKNDSIRILEAHINICFDNYLQVPTTETAKQLIKMIMIIITIVQVNLITQVQNPKKNLDFEVLASLLNNDYDRVIRKFMSKIHKKTKGKLQLTEIHSLLNYEYLQRNNIKMSQECLKTLNSKIELEVESIFWNQNKPFNKFKIKKTLEAINERFGGIFLGLRNDYEKFDILDKLCVKLLHLYFENFLRFSRRLNHHFIQKLLKKIPGDQQRLLNYFRPYVDHDVDCHVNILADLAVFLETDDYEETRILILKLLAFFDERFSTYQNINKLVKCKYYFSGYQVEQMLANFNELKRESDLQSFDKKSYVDHMTRVTSKVKKFASLLKKRVKWKRKKDVLRSETTSFKHQETNLMLQTFSVEDIYSFSSACSMLKFPLAVADKSISQYLNEYLAKTSK